MATMTLSEFLQKNADQYEAEAAKNREVVREWQEALPRLFATIRGWIAESDPKGFIEVSESKTDVREPSRHRAFDLLRGRELGASRLSSDQHVDRVACVEQHVGSRCGDPT